MYRSRVLTKRPSPSIKTAMYGFRVCACVPCQSPTSRSVLRCACAVWRRMKNKRIAAEADVAHHHTTKPTLCVSFSLYRELILDSLCNSFCSRSRWKALALSRSFWRSRSRPLRRTVSSISARSRVWQYTRASYSVDEKKKAVSYVALQSTMLRGFLLKTAVAYIKQRI